MTKLHSKRISTTTNKFLVMLSCFWHMRMTFWYHYNKFVFIRFKFDESNTISELMFMIEIVIHIQSYRFWKPYQRRSRKIRWAWLHDWWLGPLDWVFRYLWKRDFYEETGILKPHEGTKSWMWKANGSKGDVCSKCEIVRR